MTSTITVVIPSFARPAALARCVGGLARQSDEAGEFEVVVVDDGSPETVVLDPSVSLGRFDVRVVRQDRAGPGAARNAGADAARGETLAFLDDDCVPARDWLFRLAAAVRHDPEVLAGGATRNGLEESLCAEVSQLIVSIARDFHHDPKTGPRFLASNNIACSRRSFLASGGFDPSFRVASEDRELCDRWRMQGRPMTWVPDARVDHFHGQGLVDFLRLHARYGRGAFRYHAMRRARGTGDLRRDVGFYSSFASHYRRLAPRGRSLAWHSRAVALLFAWQGANALGFLAEMATGEPIEEVSP